MAAVGTTGHRRTVGGGSTAILIRRGSAEYPARLEHLDRPPPELWVRGPLCLPDDRMVAIVGTRRATEYGRRMATELAYGLAATGWTVVSGLARGIDAAAHRGALEAGGRTIAVLGCGVDKVFPASNRDLYAAVARSGLLVTEFAPGTPPRKHHFPRRNRIIAALADAVVVVQAGVPSGALITADRALDLGREVLAVPGPADQAVSEGSHRLLRDGATIATSAADVLSVLGEVPREPRVRQPSLFDPGGSDRAPSGSPGERVTERLRDGPASLPDLAAGAGLDVRAALATLSRLELRGVVRSLPGLRFELVKRP